MKKISLEYIYCFRESPQLRVKQEYAFYVTIKTSLSFMMVGLFLPRESISIAL